jgi:FkbM family methyltransferase
VTDVRESHRTDGPSQQSKMLVIEKLKRFTRACEGEGVAFAIKYALHRAAPRLFSSPPPALERVFNHLNRAKSFTIIQIGAYVGDSSNDPLASFLKATLSGNARPDAKVILVEPVREYFEKLKENYRDLSGVRFENVAIAEQEGNRDFYRIMIDPTRFGLTEDLLQLGSLRSDRMTKLWDHHMKEKKLQKFYLEHRIVEKVHCITFKQLLEKHQISEVDFLQIDAEGYDFEILKSIDFSITRPLFVNYERVLLQDSEEECRQMMRKSGYRLRDWEQDTLCTRT